MHALPRGIALDGESAPPIDAWRGTQTGRGLSGENRGQYSGRENNLRLWRGVFMAGAKFRGQVQGRVRRQRSGRRGTANDGQGRDENAGDKGSGRDGMNRRDAEALRANEITEKVIG